jgi:hypothetical protein
MTCLPSLDLFSGIGGITVALKGIAKPLAYCDNAPEALAALHGLMSRGKLPSAPVCTDVRRLTRKWLASETSERPLLVAAGFPCVGFSSIGKRQGYDNEQSGLFVEVLRVLDEFDCPVVFLENVANILKIGMPTVVRELCMKRGFSLRWCVVSASDVGAPQIRRRWFCLGVRRGFSFEAEPLKYERYNWARKSFPAEQRMMCMLNDDMVSRNNTFKRVGLLGNSVVPDAVRTAFVYLTEAFDASARPDARRVSLAPLDVSRFPHETLSMRGLSRVEWPHAGLVEPLVKSKSKSKESKESKESKTEATKVLVGVAPSSHGPQSALDYIRAQRATWKSKLVLMPYSFKTDKPPSDFIRTPMVTQPYAIKYWATPRHSNVRGGNYLTNRGCKDLTTQVRFERDTPKDMRGCDLNPVFAEYLMGYPRGWTRGADDFRDFREASE